MSLSVVKEVVEALLQVVKALSPFNHKQACGRVWGVECRA